MSTRGALELGQPWEKGTPAPGQAWAGSAAPPGTPTWHWPGAVRSSTEPQNMHLAGFGVEHWRVVC